ncbi:MAG: protein kinase [Candidatus Aramenus sp.]|nr:protein kinase [Candidatus Aramenus sp.]
MPIRPKKSAVVNGVSRSFKVVGFVLTLIFAFLSLTYYAHSYRSVVTSSHDSLALTTVLKLGLQVELILIFTFIAFSGLISGYLKALGSALLVSIGISVPGIVIFKSHMIFNDEQLVFSLLFFLGSSLVLPVLVRKRGGLKTLIATLLGSVPVLLPLLTYSLRPLPPSFSQTSDLPVLAFLGGQNTYLDEIGLLSSFGVLLGSTLASLRPGFRTGRPEIDVTLPSVAVSLAGIASFAALWGVPSALVYLLPVVGFLSFVSVVKRELGLVPAALALAISLYIAYQALKSLNILNLTITWPAPYFLSPLPLAYLYVVGVNSPLLFDPYALESKALKALNQGNYGIARNYLNMLKSYGISETEVFLEVLSSRNCNAILWMQDNFRIDYSKCGKLLRYSVDCMISKNVLPAPADKILEVLASTDQEYAEKLAGFILSKGTRDIRAQKAKQIMARLYGNHQPQQTSQQPPQPPQPQQLKAPPLDHWKPELWLGRELYGYRVTRVLGSGGTSYVLEGVRGNERYAIKIPKLSGAQKEATRASFTTFVDLSKESSKLQELSENNDAIVRIFGTFIDVNTIKSIENGETSYYLTSPPAIVMELTEGGTLNDLIKKREVILSKYWPDAVKLIFLRIAYALDFIHNPKLQGTTGYVHLDVKPQNVFFKVPPGNLGEEVLENLKYGRTVVKLGDLGSARRIGESFFEYTAEYCPIEQVEAAITRRGAQPSMDVYAFGATLYKALTGVTYNPPEVIKLMDEAVSKMLSGSVGYQEAINRAKNIYASYYGRNLGDVPERFRPIILATTHPNPAQRPKMSEVIEMLKRA